MRLPGLQGKPVVSERMDRLTTRSAAVNDLPRSRATLVAVRRSPPLRPIVAMERVARLLNKDKNSQKVFQLEDFARGIWPVAVGKTIARHTGRLRVVRDKLVVEVEDAIWQRQLFSLSGQILHSLHKCMGSMAIAQV